MRRVLMEDIMELLDRCRFIYPNPYVDRFDPNEIKEIADTLNELLRVPEE